MISREIVPFIRSIEKQYPVLTIIGPRQSGKSTLCRTLYPNYTYVSLETSHEAELAANDPVGFFDKYNQSLIIDEVQRVPQLLSYIQSRVDEPNHPHQYILTGSHQLLLMEKVSQSLAGRTTLLKLLPFSQQECQTARAHTSLDETLYTGGYPRIYDKNLNPTQWLQQYIETYVERDVRLLLNISELDLFRKFINLCAGRVGQLINYSSLGNDCGISDVTAQKWLSLLKTSFISFTLQPHFRNFNKRIIKTPKIYFYDTGLLCALLQIHSQEILMNHPLRGCIFENYVVSEYYKHGYNLGKNPALYFWRDTKGHEVDLVIDEATRLFPIEIKSSQTHHQKFADNIHHLNELQNFQSDNGISGKIIYGGSDSFQSKNIQIQSWINLFPNESILK